MQLPPSLKKLAKLSSGINEYTESGEQSKKILHNSGRAFLKSLASDLGLSDGQFQIRSNKAGIAVSGEVTLHADNIYVQISDSCMSSKGPEILFRSCKDQRDYSGGMNNFINIKDLQDGAYPGFVAKCQNLIMQEMAIATKDMIKVIQKTAKLSP